MKAADAPTTLEHLRREVAKIEGQETDLGIEACRLALGVDPIDAALGGGLTPGALHEVSAAGTFNLGAAAGFVAGLVARQGGANNLWIQTGAAAREGGDLYGCGLDLLGLPARSLLILKVRRPDDALWAMEEALKCSALTSVIVELHDNKVADLHVTQRLTLAARTGGGFGFLLRHKKTNLTSTAETRWLVAAAPSEPDQYGGLGPTTLDLSLFKNRRGPTGRWTLTWNHHERAFSALSRGVAAPAPDRQDRAPAARTG